MAISYNTDLDLRQSAKSFQKQFEDLDLNNPASWPAVPKVMLYFFVCAVVVVALWWAWLKTVNDELLAEQATEQTLRADYQAKLVKAVNLEELRKQLVQVTQYVSQLEKQLPGKAQMDALLSDINQAGLGRSLQFEVFRPGTVSVQEYYAELPIEVKVTGRYHDIGLFAADIANLSRIVTLNNVSLSPIKERDGMLTMDCTAKTFRYLDQNEIEIQAKPATGQGVPQ